MIHFRAFANRADISVRYRTDANVSGLLYSVVSIIWLTHGTLRMNKTPIVAATITLAWLAACIPANAADTAAGQKTFTAICAACHKLKSYAGKSDTELETQIKGIVAGTIKHPKKLTLSETDIADVAAYISSNEPK